MATLNGQAIDATYQGLIKTIDNAAIAPSSPKVITDGSGNASPLAISQDSVNITIPTGGTSAISGDNISVTDSTFSHGMAIGVGSVNFGGNIDFSGATVTGLPGAAGVIDGTGTNSMETSLTDLPGNATGFAAIAFGRNAQSSQDSSIALGNYATGSGSKAISIGSEVTASASNSQAYGWNTSATASGAIALGSGVTAAKVNTTTTKALELTTASTPTDGGIIMTDAGSTQRRLNIDAAGRLQVDSTEVGGSPVVTTTTKVTHAGPDTVDTDVYVMTIPANTFGAGDIVRLWAMTTADYTGGGWVYNNVQISNSATLNSGTYYTFGAQSSTSNAGWILDKSIIIHTSNGTGDGSDAGAVDPFHESMTYPNGDFTYADLQGMTLDWTSNVYIHFFGFVDNASSSLTFNGGYLKKVN